MHTHKHLKQTQYLELRIRCIQLHVHVHAHVGVTVLPELELLATGNCEGVEWDVGGDSDVGGGDSEEREEAGSGDTSEGGCP